jgi:Domain of unknown function (DUF397)
MDRWAGVCWVSHSELLALIDEPDDAADAPVWRKSSYTANGNCVEVASLAGRILVRNSRAQHGPALVFTQAEWTAFLNGVGDGEFALS